MMKLLIFSVVSLFAVGPVIGSNRNARIVDGDLSNPGEFPFYVLLLSARGLCGGTLISDRWIVTAAHCLMGKITMEARFGASSIEKYKARIKVPTRNQISHPMYDKDTTINDIALLKLPVPIEFNKFIHPVKFANGCEMPYGSNRHVIAIGMGRFKENQLDPPSNQKLRNAHLKTISVNECSIEKRRSDNTIVCTRANSRGQRVTFGDSGGPLVVESDGSLIGLTSFGVSDERTGKADFQAFTHVPYYYEWIERRTGLEMPKCTRE